MFASFTQDDWIQLAIVVALAALPAIIWSIVIFSGRKSSRWILLFSFFLGTLTVVPLILLYDFIYVRFPVLDIDRAIEANITSGQMAAMAALIVAVILEEIVKSGVVRIIGHTKIGIQTINDAVKYSILAGLGFAFTENIFYFYNLWANNGIVGLIAPMIFRSIFTVCMHMVASGIFGYYYGIARFSRPIMEARLFAGEKSKLTFYFSKIMGTDEPHAFSELTMIKGLLVAILIHGAFNSMLEYGQLFPVIFIVAGGFAYLMYLLAHKAGAIVFSASGASSSLAKRDVDTVLELLGMWSQEGRYKDVVDICQRLLIRDPDNKVVQLFQAKALDSQKLSNLEKSFTSLFSSENRAEEESSLRNLVKQKVLMEMLKEKQAAPSPQVVKNLSTNADSTSGVMPSNMTSGTSGVTSDNTPGSTSTHSTQPATPKIPKIPSPGGAQIDPSSRPENL